MASWIDVFSLLITIIIFGGVIYGIIFIVNTINKGLHSTQESLKSKGLDISSTGVSVKTSQRFTREDQIDATQRQIIRAFGASSFRKGEAPQVVEEGVPLTVSRQSSSVSESFPEDGKGKKKKRSLFGK